MGLKIKPVMLLKSILGCKNGAKVQTLSSFFNVESLVQFKSRA